MAIRLGSVVINCADIELMTQFWTAALDLQAGPLSPEGDFRVLGGSVTAISLQVAKTPVSGRDQMHLDLFTHGLGAEFVRHNEDPDDDFVVLRDPEGNFFCVCALPDVQTSEEPEEQQERAS